MDENYLLIVWHSRTGSAKSLAKAAYEGAGDHGCLMRAQDVQPKHLMDAAGYLFCCPENLASMSGETKEMFDRCYYAALTKIAGRPFATIIAAGSDGEGAQKQIDRICKGWRLKRVSKHMIVDTDAQTEEEILAPKKIGEKDLILAREMGQALGQGIAEGIF